MSARTVDWTGGPGPAEGLRERKKRLMRQQLSDTATELFVERGFDAVRVSEVAEACGVSEKTVFNYFPTKESLVMDRFQDTPDALRAALADPGRAPVRAVLAILAGDLEAMVSWFAAQPDPAETIAKVQRFAALIQSTPALRAYQRDLRDQLTDIAAGVLADRSGFDPADPEPRIAATALLGLWDVHLRSLSRHLRPGRAPGELRQAVTTDVERAAHLLEVGLSSFEVTS